VPPVQEDRDPAREASSINFIQSRYSHPNWDVDAHQRRFLYSAIPPK